MKEISVRISKEGTLTLPKEVKDEFKGSTAKLFRSKSDRFTIVKTVPKVAKSSLRARETISGREISREEMERFLRKERPDLFESARDESEKLTYEEVIKRFRELGKTITPEELDEAIREVRAEEAKRKNW